MKTYGPIIAADLRTEAVLREVYTEEKVGVEIGVFTGDLSCRLLKRHRGLTLFMVDPWSVVADQEYADTGDFHTKMSQETHDLALRRTLQQVHEFEGRYQVIRETSKAASKLFHDEVFDFVFIDGDHSYKGCKEDIECWYPKLKPGGLLSGHDYRTDKTFGVIQAVTEFLADKPEKELRLAENYTWFITK